MLYFNYILAMLGGAAVSVYLPMIAQSSRIMGSPFMGNVPFFGIAFATSIIISLLAGQRPGDYSRMADVPAWMFLAGIVSALMIILSSYLIPKVGPAAFFVLLVAGQILVGFVINQYGLLGVPVQPMNLTKAIGGALVIGGAALVTFSSGT
ncbi:MAG: DMT family transporter [Hyphomicrobiaceae bacterium]|nr:DMT family transporter [Hyphomicrobiaceae bacterium]MCC0024918.1 DMT family transporter [Hyphomicrobiaceae bacterium]